MWSRCVGGREIASKSELEYLIEELFNRDALSDDAYTKAKKTLIAVHGDGVDDEIDTAYTGDIKQLI